jgi:hypothetical protein
VHARLVEPGQLPAERVELAVARNEPRPAAQVERRQEAEREPVRVLVEGDRAAGVADEGAKSFADALRLRECALPLVVDGERGVVPGLDDTLAPDVRPGLVRMPRQATRNAE